MLMFIECIKRVEEKKRKCEARLAFIFFFRNQFNNFNNTGARILDSIYHRTLKSIKNRIVVVKTSRFCDILRSVMDVIT